MKHDDNDDDDDEEEQDSLFYSAKLLQLDSCCLLCLCHLGLW